MRFRPTWSALVLGLVAAGAVVAAVIELGPPSSSARTSRTVVTAAKGVVQSTVTGTGNVEPGTDVEANFQTSGTLQHLYVKDGDKVIKGQLLATLDPTAAQSQLDQAQENLTAAEDQLTNAEEATVTQSSSAPATATAEEVAFHPTTTATTSATTTTTTPATSTTTVTATGSTPQRTTPAPAQTQTQTATTPSHSSSGGSTSSGGSNSSSSSQSSGETAATKAANIASAQASVDGAEADVTNAETALHETHLYAPATGTVVNVESISIGDEVSGSSSGSSSSSSSNASSSASPASTTAGGLGSAGNSTSSSSSSSSSGLVEIVATSKMTMTVAFSESDISKVKVGQPASVTLEALSGVQLAAHVTAISTLGTTSSSVVSYNATLTLNQHDARVKPGMSASASVITRQASGVTLPTSAVTTRGAAATVNLWRGGKTISTPVAVGLEGDSRTQIVSGVRAGDQVVVTQTLPSLGSGSSSSGTGSSGTLGGASGRLGAFPAAGGGGFAGGGGGGGFARRFGGG